MSNSVFLTSRFLISTRLCRVLAESRPPEQEAATLDNACDSTSCAAVRYRGIPEVALCSSQAGSQTQDRHRESGQFFK